VKKGESVKKGSGAWEGRKARDRVRVGLGVGGFKAVLTLYWLDRQKPALLAGLPMFADDMAAALAAGVLTKLYDKLIHGV